MVAAAVDAIVATGGSVPMTRLARAAGLSERHFRRRFVAATGLAPKFYADVQRVRRALILALEDDDWAGVAAEAGFADQPHLARDVKERFGAAPGRIGGYFRGMRHELVAPPDGRFVQDDEAQAA
jgi:transcriptional regulator GlxA family with amidase domain